MHILPKDEIIFIKYLHQFSSVLCELHCTLDSGVVLCFYKASSAFIIISINPQPSCVLFYSNSNNLAVNIPISVRMCRLPGFMWQS